MAESKSAALPLGYAPTKARDNSQWLAHTQSANFDKAEQDLVL